MAQGRLIATSRRSADIQIDSAETVSVESPLHTVLLQGISKGDRMDYTIQKAVEMGITEIQPLFTEHCDVKLSGDKLAKKQQQWQAIAINACEQSGRNTIPTILTPQNHQAWLSERQKVNGLVLNPTAQNRLSQLSDEQAKQLTAEPIYLLIGPEGGLSDAEVEQAEQSGFLPIQLGPRVLRTETAGLVVLSALQMLWGDL